MRMWKKQEWGSGVKERKTSRARTQYRSIGELKGNAEYVGRIQRRDNARMKMERRIQAVITQTTFLPRANPLTSFSFIVAINPLTWRNEVSFLLPFVYFSFSAST